MKVDLSQFDNSHYSPGRNFVLQAAWFFIGLPILRCSILPQSSIRRTILRLFGAQIGPGVIIKPGVRVKYPWNLTVGANTWLGEDCWIDNLAPVSIGANACLSQGTFLCTGNHDWTDRAFGLIVKPITISEGAWVGARAVLLPGVTLHECAIAAAGAVVNRDIPAFEIHAGNPACFSRTRTMKVAVQQTAEANAHLAH